MQIPSVHSPYIYSFHFLPIIFLGLKNSCGMKINGEFRESMDGRSCKTNKEKNLCTKKDKLYT